MIPGALRLIYNLHNLHPSLAGRNLPLHDILLTVAEKGYPCGSED
jgi:hypothetical protein